MSNNEPPSAVFDAVTSSTRQLLSLLKCISFLPKAQVQISADGLRVTVEDSRVMQGHAFIDKNLFNTYTFHPAAAAAAANSNPEANEEEEEDPTTSFSISLTALLECLQIFGDSPRDGKWGSSPGGSGGGGGGISSTLRRGGPAAVFDQQVLRVSGTCRICYEGEGHPLCLILEENGVVTTCELVTYEPESIEDIPLARESLAQKIIMRASWLHDAISELDGSAAERLIITASPQHPFFSLSSAGAMGSTIVEFSNDRSLLETFQVPELIQNTYKFHMIKHALRAMSIATKVSIRGDHLGVLSLQFMIEHEGGSPSFIDFRFLPYETEAGDGEED